MLSRYCSLLSHAKDLARNHRDFQMPQPYTEATYDVLDQNSWTNANNTPVQMLGSPALVCDP